MEPIRILIGSWTPSLSSLVRNKNCFCFYPFDPLKRVPIRFPFTVIVDFEKEIIPDNYSHII